MKLVSLDFRVRGRVINIVLLDLKLGFFFLFSIVVGVGVWGRSLDF